MEASTPALKRDCDGCRHRENRCCIAVALQVHVLVDLPPMHKPLRASGLHVSMSSDTQLHTFRDAAVTTDMHAACPLMSSQACSQFKVH